MQTSPSSPIRLSIKSNARFKRSLGILVTLAGLLGSVSAHATADLDRLYLLERLGVLKSWDNIDGLFQDYVSIVYREYFADQSRFIIQDLSKADEVFAHSKAPYEAIIDDPQVLSQLARSTRSETILRTKIIKVNRQYQITLDWFHAPKIELIASESVRLEEPKTGKPLTVEEVRFALKDGLDHLFRKLPFQGHVTGRDGDTVTINLGLKQGVRRSDTVLLGTIEEAKKHPLLKSISEFRLAPAGRIEIDEVDELISFGHVTEEPDGKAIARYQKVLQVIPKQAIPDAPKTTPDGLGTELKEDDQIPRMGFINPGVWLGSMNRQFGLSKDSGGKSGGGLLFGAKAEAQLWLVSKLFIHSDFTYAFWNHTQTDLITGNASTAGASSGTLNAFKIGAGYAYLPTGDFMGPKAWLKLGYQSHKYNLPTSATDYMGSATVGGLGFGLGGELPIQEPLSIQLGVDFGLLSSGETTGISGYLVDGASPFQFSLGVLYRLKPKLAIRGSIDVVSDSIDFTDGSNLTHRSIVLSPGLVFYF